MLEMTSSHLPSRALASMRYCSEKSILAKQVNDSILTGVLLILFLIVIYFCRNVINIHLRCKLCIACKESNSSNKYAHTQTLNMDSVKLCIVWSDNEKSICTWWRLFQKCAVHTELGIYKFITPEFKLFYF